MAKPVTVVAALVAGLALWVGGGEIVRRVGARDLPMLPELAHASPLIASQLRQLDRAARVTPRSAEAVGALAIAYHANLFAAEARQAYASAARRAPSDWRWPYYLALTAEERGETTQVVEHLEAALGIEPHLPLAWFRLGEAEFKRGRFDEAGAALARVLAITSGVPGDGSARLEAGSRRSPVSAYASTTLARVALQKGDAATARSILEHVVANEGRQWGPAFRLLADACRQTADVRAATRALEAADRLPAYVPPPDPLVDRLGQVSRNSAFLLKYAAIATRAHDPTAREFLTRRAFEFDPDNPAVIFEMGTLLQAMGRHEEALAQYQRHRTLMPGQPQTDVQIGRCLADLNRLQEAEATLRGPAARGDATAEFNLGEVLDRQDRVEEARRHYERAIAINPFHARAFNNLGILAARRGRLNDALALFEKAAVAAPGDADMQNNLGAALVQSGRVEEARRAFERAIAIEPGHQDARRNLAQVVNTRE